MSQRGGQVCRDFLRGSCRFGSRCKFVHQLPQQQQNVFGGGAGRQGQSKGGGGSAAGNGGGANRFAPLVGAGSGGKAAAQKPTTAASSKEHKCSDPRACQEVIRDDRAHEWPLFWRATCYAHWKYLPNDIGGDVSPEELRWEAHCGLRQGQPFAAIVQQERALFAHRTLAFDKLLASPYVSPANPRPAFGSPSPSPSPAAGAMLFGKPVGGTPPPPAFGQPSSTGGGIFGSGPAPSPFPGFSPFGAKPSPGFSTPATPRPLFGAQSGGSPFGASPLAPSPFPFFGQPSQVGQLAPFGSSVPSPALFGTPQAVGAAVPGGGGGAFGAAQPLGAQAFGGTQSLGGTAPFGGTPQTMTAASPWPPAQSPQTSSAAGIPGANGGALTTGTKAGGDDRWHAEKWSLGQIPEEEPPPHVR